MYFQNYPTSTLGMIDKNMLYAFNLGVNRVKNKITMQLFWPTLVARRTQNVISELIWRKMIFGMIFSPVPRAKRNIEENNSIRYFNFFNPFCALSIFVNWMKIHYQIFKLKFRCQTWFEWENNIVQFYPILCINACRIQF